MAILNNQMESPDIPYCLTNSIFHQSYHFEVSRNAN